MAGRLAAPHAAPLPRRRPGQPGRPPPRSASLDQPLAGESTDLLTRNHSVRKSALSAQSGKAFVKAFPSVTTITRECDWNARHGVKEIDLPGIPNRTRT